MSAAAIFTKRFMGMDYRVWFVMPVIWVLAVTLLGYRYLNEKPCGQASIAVDGKSSERLGVRYVHQLVKFEIQTKGATEVLWKFEDETQKGSAVYHEFTKEGQYTVKATLQNDSGACSCREEILVKNKDDELYQEKPDFQIFSYPEKSKYSTRETISFQSENINLVPKSYRWTVVQTGEEQSNPTANFKFSLPGAYTVQLVLNNDKSIARSKKIEVFADDASTSVKPESFPPTNGPGGLMPIGPLVDPGKGNPTTRGVVDSAKQPKDVPAGNMPPKNAVREVDKDAFKAMLQSVVEGQKDLEDLYGYLDYKGTTVVEVNGDKNGSMPLKDFCKKMSERKKNRRKIEKLEFVRDDKKSISRIQVTVPDKPWWWPF